MSPTPSRISIVGPPGAGKTTLARALAERLGVQHLKTDAAYWRPGWRAAPTAEVRAWLEEACAAERWVIDGNFDNDRDVYWGRADLIVWLDFPVVLTVAR